MDELLAGETSWPAHDMPRVLDATTADAASRAAAMPAGQAAWWWATQGDARDPDARDLQVLRLRMGIDLLVVEEHRAAAVVRTVKARARRRPRD